MTEAWQARSEALLGRHPRLLATAVHNKLRTPKGSVAPIRRQWGLCARSAGPGSGNAAAAVPIHTGPREETQFDFCNFDADGDRQRPAEWWGFEVGVVVHL